MSRARRLVVAFLVTAAGVACSSIVALPVALLLVSSAGVGAFATLVVASEIGYAVVGYGFVQISDAEVDPSWTLPREHRRGIVLVVAGTVAAVAINRAGFFLASLVGVDPVATVVPPTGLDPIVATITLAPVLVLVVGPVEEYLFRGVLQRYLATGDGFSTASAIGWAAVLFALVHVPTVLQTAPIALAVTGPVLLAVGLLLGWLYERAGTLVVPALVHGLYDVAVFWLLLSQWG